MEILGVIYFKENKFALAWQYYRNSLRLYAKQKNDQGMATIYSHLAGFYLNKPDSMLYFAFKAKAIWDRINPDYFMAGENIGNIAAAYYSMATDSLHPAKENKTALLQKAEQYFSIALDFARKTRRVQELIIFYNQLAGVQNLLHEYKQAYDNSVKAYDLNDSLYSQDEKNKVASLDEKYQVQLREDQLAANRKPWPSRPGRNTIS
jgi:hypothetical protein